MYDIIICCVAAFALYYNTLYAEFAYDDSRAIIQNPDLRPSTSLSQILTDDFWGTPIRHSGSHKSYRPLCVFSFRLNYAVGELDPFGYHLTNVALHVIATGIFVIVARKLLRSEFSVLFAGMLFTSHPIHTEAVAGVVGRADVGACLFTLLSFMCYSRFCDDYAKRNSHNDHVFTSKPKTEGEKCTHTKVNFGFWILSSFFTFCATFTKEQGIMVIAINAAYELFVVHQLRISDLPQLFYKAKFHQLRTSLLLQATLGGALLCLRFYVTGIEPPIFAPADNPASTSKSLLARTLTFLYLPACNAWMLLYPKTLSFDWSMESVPLIQTITDVRNLASLFLYGSIFSLGVFSLREINFLNNEADKELHFSKTVPSRKYSVGSNSAIYKEQMGVDFKNGYTLRSSGKESKHLRNGQTKRTSFPEKRENNNTCAKCKEATDSTHKRSVHPRRSSSSPERSRSSRRNSLGCHRNKTVGASPEEVAERSRRLNVIVIAASFLIFPFLPATNLFFYVGFVIAERILYIPSVGYCLLVAEGVGQMWHRCGETARKLIVGYAVIHIVLFSAKTLDRNAEWLTEESLYRAGIEVNPPKALGNLANIYKTAGRIEDAEMAYRRALTYRRNMADVHYNLGVLLQEVGRLEEAIESYQMAIKCRPRMSMAHLNLGIALTSAGRPLEAEAVYKQASTLDDAGLKDPRGQMHGIISSLFNLGRLLQEGNRHEEALSVLEEAIERKPDYYSPQSLYNMLGETHYKLGDLTEAEKWFQESLSSKADHVPAHLTYANLLGKTNRATDAKHFLDRAIKLEPDNANVYRHYGQFWHDIREFVKASEYYRSALALQPDDFEITFNLANSLRQAKENGEAEVYYRQAVHIKPNVANGHVNLGAMLHLNGKLEEAEKSYLRALDLKPDDATSLQNLRKLRNLMAKQTSTETPLETTIAPTTHQ